MTPHPSPETVRAAVGRITASAGFVAAERMRRFIRFVVDRTLAGEAESLKEYSIGVEVFERGENFDSRTDTIVRVEARRLRKKLQEYYAGEGKLDPVGIGLPSGSYVPVFEARPMKAAKAKRRWWLAAGGAAAAGVMALAWGLNRGAERPPSSEITSIAVLAFADLSSGKDQEYLCDGLSEELINALSAIPNLKVAARTSAFRFKGKAEDIRRVGADLGVEHIVEGSVRTSGKQIRVTAQLVRARDGYQVWSRQFDRELTEIFSIQEEVARLVAASVGAELETGSGLVRPRNPDAYRDYLEGRHFGRQFLPSSTGQAVEHFERAIAEDPAFAPAHAGLANSYIQMNVWAAGPPSVLATKARAAATRAVSLDPNSAEGEAQLGAVSAFYDWDWKGCEEHFRRAIELQPTYVDAHWLYATACLGPQGRLDAALEEARRAVELDPLSPLTRTMLGAVYFYRRESDKAIEALDAALRLDPSYRQASLFKTFVYLAQGRVDLAAGNEDQGVYRAYIQAKLGNRATALDLLMAARGQPLGMAAGYAGLGQSEKSLDWLEKAADGKAPQMIWIHFQAAFEPLHGTARYQAIRARMHLE